MNGFRFITQITVTLLMVIAGIVCAGLFRGWNMWAWIVAYWALLTLKNFMDAYKHIWDWEE